MLSSLLMKKLTVFEVEQELKNFDPSSVEKPTRNKGSRGRFLEDILGIENSSSLKDMIDGDVKSFTMGETVAITSLNHCLPGIIENSLEYVDTKVYDKCRNVIFIAFTRKNEYIGSTTVSQDAHFDKYLKFAEDYGYISAKIRALYSEGLELNTITGPNNLLQIRTRASKNKSGTYSPLIYNGVYLKDKAMAFYFCSNYVKSIL